MTYFTSEIEKQKRAELLKLMRQWKAVIKTKDKITFSDDGKKYDAIEFFNSDGFYPGYFKKGRKRVLFIGREARGISGTDRILHDLKNYFKTANINTSTFWRRILYIVYGIQKKGKKEYSEIPYAKEILAEMQKKNDYGFALMNISKYSNDAENGATANFKLINQFLQDSELTKRNFIREEISILDPDIIITANLWAGRIDCDELEKIIPEKDCKCIKNINDTACLYDFNFNGKIIKLIDLFHFSRSGSDEKLFYTPTMELLFK